MKRIPNKTIQINANKWFAVFCCLHLFFWTTIPALVSGCIPFDSAESIAWGWQWQLGYFKHPPFTAWITALATYAGGVEWPIYLLAQIVVILTFIAVFQLAKKMLTPIHALIAVLCLEAVLPFSLMAPFINPTSMLLPVWAWSAYFFYAALTEQKNRYWIFLGFLSAINILTKYQGVLLFLPMFVLTLMTQQGRKSYKRAGIYLAVFICFILILPHFIGSSRVGFPEIKYALSSTTGNMHAAIIWTRHFIYPARFMLSALGFCIGAFVITLPFWFSKQKNQLKNFDWQFILWIGLFPFAFTLFFSLFSDSFLDANWAVPYFFLIGVIIIAFLNPIVYRHLFKIFIGLLIIAIVLIFILRYGVLLTLPYVTGKAESSAYLPAKAMADQATQLWHQRYHTKLAYVTGDHYDTAYVTVYSPDHPKPYFDTYPHESPWINLKDFKKKGSIFILPMKNNFKDLSSVKKQYPQLENLEIYDFHPTTSAHVPSINIAIGFISPAH
ncbi:MAG: hypothetical protein A2298_01855 [Gammaproteobacteria bacterium RIFOXYB2_FULL_38_6]|nr:MAG: hypothetical protein A2298_01855 [Gammaproteobacteria bacterium RIFOXYB2_FULL_38_6]